MFLQRRVKKRVLKYYSADQSVKDFHVAHTEPDLRVQIW